MKPEDIKNHWRDWSVTHGTSLRATTKTPTAKEMEIDALTRAFRRIVDAPEATGRVLEVGCGNGQNCLRLAGVFPALNFTGVDYIGEMVAAAMAVRDAAGIDASRLDFHEDDAMVLGAVDGQFDIVFTDRCLINFNTDDLQKQAISTIAERIVPGGHLIMIENSQQTYGRQNRARELLGLEPRSPAEFNHFFDEEVILPHLEELGLHVLDIEDFLSLHDLALYVLVPAINGGVVDYDHPLVEAAMRLNIGLSNTMPDGLGALGQNRLYFCRKSAGA